MILRPPKSALTCESLKATGLLGVLSIRDFCSLVWFWVSGPWSITRSDLLERVGDLRAWSIKGSDSLVTVDITGHSSMQIGDSLETVGLLEAWECESLETLVLKGTSSLGVECFGAWSFKGSDLLKDSLTAEELVSDVFVAIYR